MMLGLSCGIDPLPLVEELHLSDLILDLDAAAGVTVAGGIVTAWADQSGQGNNGTPTGSPVLSANAINGLPAMQLVQASSQAFTLPDSFTALTQAELFVIIKSPNPSTSPSFHNMHNDSASLAVFPFSDGNIYDSWGSNLRKATGAPVQSITSQLVLYNVRSAAGAWSSYINGQQQFTTASNTVAFNNAPAVGRSTAGATTRYFEGLIARYMVFKNVQTSTVRAQIHQYLRLRYGLTIS